MSDRSLPLPLPARRAFDTSQITLRAFRRIAHMVHAAAGIRLVEEKQALVVARLAKKLPLHGCRNFEEYAALAAERSEVLGEMVDALTTNYTSFLREPAHFRFLREVILPELASRPGFELWCAAAATGEEPFSLAFTILDALGPSAAERIRILATDISERALAHGRSAIYPERSFQAMPESWLPRFLLRGEGNQSGLYQVKPEVRRMVTWRQLNLVEEFEPGGVFPLIACRNVMIYFDPPTQARVVERMGRFLEPGGYFLVGHAESLTAFEHSLHYVQAATYRKAGGRTGGSR